MNGSHAEEFQNEQDNVCIIGGVVEETGDVELGITHDRDYQIFEGLFCRREIRFDSFYMYIKKKAGPVGGWVETVCLT